MGVFNSIGNMFAAGAEEDSLNAQADALYRDAQVQELNAVMARESGEFNASRQQTEANKLIGTTRADVAASGITQDSVSVESVLRESFFNSELDRLNIIHGADIEAINYKNKATAQRSKADAIKDGADDRRTATFFNSVGGLFSMGSNGGGNGGGGGGD